MRLFDIFLQPKDQIIGKKIEFTIKDLEIKENTGEAILTFVEIPNIIIKIGSKIESKKATRRKKNI